MITYEQFLSRVIEDGIAAANADYRDRLPERRGSVCGFEACRGKSPAELAEALEMAQQAVAALIRRESEFGTSTYWYYRCMQLEIEWVCNVVSAALTNENLPVIIRPTARGVLKAAEILGAKA